MPKDVVFKQPKKEGQPIDWMKILQGAIESIYSPTGYKGKPVQMVTERPSQVKQQYPHITQLAKGVTELKPMKEGWTERAETEKRWKKYQDDYKVYLKEYNKVKTAWEKMQEERKSKLIEMYTYAQENRLPSYEPSVSQVGMGMPFGVPINLAPMMMQGLTQQEQQRQQTTGWQERIGMELDPRVRATLPEGVLNIPKQLQQALDQSQMIKEAKSDEEKIAKGQVFNRVGMMVEQAKREKKDPNVVILELMSTDPELLAQAFGYAVTPQDIADAYKLYTQTMLGEFGQ